MIKTNIYAVPLKKLDGFGYVEIFPNPIFGSQVRLSNLFSSTILHLDEVRSHDNGDLTYRLCLNGEPKVTGSKDSLVWYLLGHGEIDLESLKNVDFKVGAGSFLDHEKNWSKYNNWLVMSGFDMSTKEPEKDYASIRHLPLWLHRNYVGMTELIQMFWLKEKELSIINLYKEEIEASIIIRKCFYEVINSTPYSQIPKKLHNKRGVV